MLNKGTAPIGCKRQDKDIMTVNMYTCLDGAMTAQRSRKMSNIETGASPVGNDVTQKS